MASKKKTLSVSEKYELVGIEPGRYGVGSRIINTENLDQETCEYLLGIKWPHIKRIDKKADK